MPQKFKRGNLVKILVGHRIWTRHEDGTITERDIRPDWVGKQVIIDYNYFEKYGGVFEDSQDSYSIVFLENGSSSAWFNAIDLEFIEEGGEYLFKQAKENYEKLRQQLKIP